MEVNTLIRIAWSRLALYGRIDIMDHNIFNHVTRLGRKAAGTIPSISPFYFYPEMTPRDGCLWFLTSSAKTFISQ